MKARVFARTLSVSCSNFELEKHMCIAVTKMNGRLQKRWKETSFLIKY